MINSKLLLTTATSLDLAAQAEIALPTVPHAGAITQVQWHRHGWGWNPFAWLGLGAGVVAGAIIADEAYRPHPGHFYDEGPYDGPYLRGRPAA